MEKKKKEGEVTDFTDGSKNPEGYLHPFSFRYLPHSKQWAASTDIRELWNDLNSDVVIVSERISVLTDLIIKYKGDIKKLKKELK